MPTSKASATWEGSLKEGKGSMKPAHGADVPFAFPTRFEGKSGSNPEEMIGAALAGCFSMALSAGLGKAGHTPASIRTTADVKLETVDGKPTVTTIDLVCEASVPGIDAAQFQQIADETKSGCPISRALAGVNVNLQAKLGG